MSDRFKPKEDSTKFEILIVYILFAASIQYRRFHIPIKNPETSDPLIHAIEYFIDRSILLETTRLSVGKLSHCPKLAFVLRVGLIEGQRSC